MSAKKRVAKMDESTNLRQMANASEITSFSPTSGRRKTLMLKPYYKASQSRYESK